MTDRQEVVKAMAFRELIGVHACFETRGIIEYF